MKTQIKFKHIAAIGITCMTVAGMSACKKTHCKDPIHHGKKKPPTGSLRWWTAA